ncbi:MAG TPA: DUF2252 family protein [Candidatus Binatia bacterium]|nr:DUF2252 family protein [Candidatus Binatia bacterium]
MNIVKSTRLFEQWLAQHTNVVKKDLRLKHANMKLSAFRFLRGTYYRWAQLWPELCTNESRVPRVLAVGDLHIDNFGTWRDVEGRLIWGINDFDEAYPLPYTNDLIRLAVSAHLASDAGHLSLKKNDICDAILEGYLQTMQQGGLPFVLEEQNEWLREIALTDLRDPVRFWKKMEALPTASRDVPVSAIDAMEHLFPAPNLKYRIARRVAGLGSLGHPRYVALAKWNGHWIAREAKALVPSSCHWAGDHHAPAEILYQSILSRAVRCPDPFVQLRGQWIVRRLSPHCSRIELTSLEVHGSETRLLNSMGRETANVHLGTRSAAKDILRHAKRQRRTWLHEATQTMLRRISTDWKVWKKDGYE